MTEIQIIPVVALTSPQEYFRCVPYSAAIRGEVCLRRQRDRVLQRSHGVESALHARCVSCELGANVAARVGDQVEDRGAVPAAVIQRFRNPRREEPRTPMAAMCRTPECDGRPTRQGKRADLDGLCRKCKMRRYGAKYDAKRRAKLETETVRVT
jgi:hypothetical protein